MRRDEIRIFRGDVENYVQRLRAFCPSSAPVRFERSFTCSALPDRTIPYHTPRRWEWLKTFVYEKSVSGFSALIAAIIVLAVPFVGGPTSSVELRVTFTVIAFLFPGFWVAWEWIERWSQQD